MSLVPVRWPVEGIHHGPKDDEAVRGMTFAPGRPATHSEASAIHGRWMRA